jgi:hypothetical protein
MIISTRTFYLRDKRNFPIATVATELSELGGVFYGITSWNPKDVFDKALSREIAIGRLEVNPSYLPVHENFKRAVITDIANRRDLPKRTREAAQRWLDAPRTEFMEGPL